MVIIIELESQLAGSFNNAKQLMDSKITNMKLWSSIRKYKNCVLQAKNTSLIFIYYELFIIDNSLILKFIKN